MNRRSFIVTVASALLFPKIVLGSSNGNGKITDHFDGKRFHNINANLHSPSNFGNFIKWQFNREKKRWKGLLGNRPYRRPLEAPPRTGLRVTYIGHATTLIETAGLAVLTDPVWSQRVGPASLLGPMRRSAPGLRFDDLPRIDLVVVSHNHYDHMDMATLKRLKKKFNPVFVLPKANGRYLTAHGITKVVELDWWESVPIRDTVTVTAVPARHFSNRGMFDYNQALWAGLVVSGPGGDTYFAGDTGYGQHFAMIAARFPALKLAILPIGAYRPEWFMSEVHMSPADAVKAHHDLKTGHSLAIHFGTFELADDGQDEPVVELRKLTSKDEELRRRFHLLDFGESIVIP